MSSSLPSFSPARSTTSSPRHCLMSSAMIGVLGVAAEAIARGSFEINPSANTSAFPLAACLMLGLRRLAPSPFVRSLGTLVATPAQKVARLAHALLEQQRPTHGA